MTVRGLGRDIEDLTGEVDFDRQVIRLRDGIFHYAGRPVKVSGSYQLGEGKVLLSLQGSLPLAVLDRPLPGIKEYSGEADVELELSGVAPHLSYRASVTVREGMVRFTDFQTPMHDLKLRLAINDEYIRVEEGSGTLSGGLVTCTGYLVLPWGREPEEINLSLGVDKILINVPGTLKLVASAEVSLRGSPEGYLLKGQVILHRGKYTRDMSPRPVISLGSESGGGLLPSASSHPILSRLRLDLHVIAEEGFWIDNNVAQVNTGFDLSFRGTAAEPIVSGQVRVQKGAIFYLGKKFDLEEATLVFPDTYPPNPFINAQATTVISSIKVYLLAQGTMAALTLDLSSDPPYSREDIISLLTLGAIRSSLTNRGGEVSAVGALMVFSGALLGKLEDQARSFTGLEVFQVEPTLSDTGGAARLVMGKQLSDQIFVSYSRNLSVNGDEQFSMEYQLLDFLSLVGRQERSGVYSFDLVFTVGGFHWLRE